MSFGICGTYYQKGRYFHLCASVNDGTLVYCGDARESNVELMTEIEAVPFVSEKSTFYDGIARKIVVVFRDFDAEDPSLSRARALCYANDDVPIAHIEKFYPNYERSSSTRVIRNQRLL